MLLVFFAKDLKTTAYHLRLTPDSLRVIWSSDELSGQISRMHKAQVSDRTI